MSFHNRAIQSYGSVQASSSLAGAQGLQLTQMLFDGLVDALVALRGHLLHRSVAAKAAQVAKVHRIVVDDIVRRIKAGDFAGTYADNVERYEGKRGQLSFL